MSKTYLEKCRMTMSKKGRIKNKNEIMLDYGDTNGAGYQEALEILTSGKHPEWIRDKDGYLTANKHNPINLFSGNDAINSVIENKKDELLDATKIKDGQKQAGMLFDILASAWDDDRKENGDDNLLALYASNEVWMMLKSIIVLRAKAKGLAVVQKEISAIYDEIITGKNN